MGSVIEVRSEQPIEFASVVIHQNSTGEFLTGTTTDEAGKFLLEVSTKDIKVEVSFLGLSSIELTDINFQDQTANLGVIRLSEDSQALDEVIIAADKSTTEFKLDKRVFNVGTDLSSTGASALEVLNNVPSVNVNIEGEVSLRGATGVQILINGKPSILSDDASNALGTITADMI